MLKSKVDCVVLIKLKSWLPFFAYQKSFYDMMCEVAVAKFPSCSYYLRDVQSEGGWSYPQIQEWRRLPAEHPADPPEDEGTVSSALGLSGAGSWRLVAMEPPAAAVALQAKGRCSPPLRNCSPPIFTSLRYTFNGITKSNAPAQNTAAHKNRRFHRSLPKRNFLIKWMACREG